MCSTIYWCFPPHLPGFVEAGLHSIYTGFFLIESCSYGLNLEQKFHGVLQILLINFYIVLLCILFIRWHIRRRNLGCHLLISLASCTLTIFIGQMILMYLSHMEMEMATAGGRSNLRDPNPMKMDFIILVLDILFYILITSTYITLLIRISVQLNKSVRLAFYSEDVERSVEDTVSTIEGNSYSSFMEEIGRNDGNLTRF